MGMTIYDNGYSFSATEGRALSKNSGLFSHIAEGGQRAHSYTSTTVCCRHHGWTGMLARTELSTLLLLHRHNILGACGGQYILK